MGIAIFNPRVITYRRKLLEKIVGASVYPVHWPRWLSEETDSLIRLGLSKTEICERILNENNVYVKMHSLNRKIEMEVCTSRSTISAASP